MNALPYDIFNVNGKVTTWHTPCLSLQQPRCKCIQAKGDDINSFLSFFLISYITCTQHHNNLSHKVCPKFKCHTLYKWTKCKLHGASTFEHVQHIFNDLISHWPNTKTSLCVTPLLDALTFFNVKIVHLKAFYFERYLSIWVYLKYWVNNFET